MKKREPRFVSTIRMLRQDAQSPGFISLKYADDSDLSLRMPGAM